MWTDEQLEKNCGHTIRSMGQHGKWSIWSRQAETSVRCITITAICTSQVKTIGPVSNCGVFSSQGK